MAFLPAALAVAGSVLSGVSAIQQGNYQNAVAQMNAQMAEKYAAAESEAAQREAMRSDIEYAQLSGEQFAAQAASGLDVLGRTQLATRRMTQRVAGEARTDIRQRGTYESMKRNQEAANFRAEGSAAKKQGLVSGIGSFLQAGSDAYTGFGGKSLATKRSRRGSSYGG